MCFIKTINKKFSLLLLLLFALTTVMAQGGPATEKTTTQGYNLLAVLLIITTIVLAFVLWGLGQVLVVLGRQLLEKSKNASKEITTVLIIILAFASQTAVAQDSGKEVATVIPNYGGLSSTAFYLFVTVITTEVLAILFLVFSIRRIYTDLLPQKKAAAKTPVLRSWWLRLDQKLFTKAVPVEKETDVMMDHDYDGIRELDNALPPWWKYGFYITIVVAIIYLFNFHVFGSGKNPAEEYAVEMEEARIQKEIFEAGNKDKIDENNVPMADAAGLAQAKEIFTAKCWPCHGKLGEGGAGPNLTDSYWLHKGSLNDIFQTIKNGYPDKGMQSWSNDFTPKQISFLASYIKTLHGTNPPNAKAAQGDLFEDNPVATAPADSSKKMTQDTLVNKK